jgi:hypothetical protein
MSRCVGDAPNNCEMESVGRALPLITVDNESRFTVHHETLDVLKHQQNQIGIVAVAGLYRTGKSYLLNLLTASGASGFEVGSTINACTKGKNIFSTTSTLMVVILPSVGIWIWSKPVYDAEKNIYVYFMDTEGLGSTSRSSTHDRLHLE